MRQRKKGGGRRGKTFARNEGRGEGGEGLGRGGDREEKYSSL